MPTLLHVDASPLGPASVSRYLTAEFAANWQKAHPGIEVIKRDLTASDLHVVDVEWIGASYTPLANRTDRQNEILHVSDELIEELRAADEYIIGTPMHNFTIASSLRLWIDLIARAGETFAYSSGGPEGLLKGKSATFIVSAGGVYGSGTGRESFNFVEPYLRTVFGFLGVTNTQFHLADDVAAVMSGKVDRDVFLKTHVQSMLAA